MRRRRGVLRVSLTVSRIRELWNAHYDSGHVVIERLAENVSHWPPPRAVAPVAGADRRRTLSVHAQSDVRRFDEHPDRRRGRAQQRLGGFFAVPALLVVHVIAVIPEERYLEETFGAGYADLKRRVRRYL